MKRPNMWIYAIMTRDLSIIIKNRNSKNKPRLFFSFTRAKNFYDKLSKDEQLKYTVVEFVIKEIVYEKYKDGAEFRARKIKGE
jgi:hypothetical protein